MGKNKLNVSLLRKANCGGTNKGSIKYMHMYVHVEGLLLFSLYKAFHCSDGWQFSSKNRVYHTPNRLFNNL